ncbi:hypothetical protein GV794_01415 [Nocardia cyriacigeorgica]|uniref:Uncharacterized protein n=1 Tax=Nocardia cyriacigeorgica TaxID=135487 RepID=A0ABX0CEW4_9NOCA|nr:hypothetical protein [Nocardia cyriacigeorgica]NEW54331.1 hypothetical protein [Nocardia cyriacigeorgica]
MPEADTGFRMKMRRANHHARDVIRTPVYGTNPNRNTARIAIAVPDTKVTAGLTGTFIAHMPVTAMITTPAPTCGNVYGPNGSFCPFCAFPTTTGTRLIGVKTLMT